MPIKSYKLGDGSLVFDDGAPFDVSLQVTGCQINTTENVSTTDAVPVLGGGELPAEDIASYSQTISGNVIQDADLAGFVVWTHENKGVEVGATFVPSDTEAVKWTGTVRVVPLTVGGSEVKQRPRSDFEWRAVGLFTPSAVV